MEQDQLDNYEKTMKCWKPKVHWNAGLDHYTTPTIINISNDLPVYILTHSNTTCSMMN